MGWKETEEFRREDYYLAQIAACVTRGHVKNPRSVTLQRMLLDFKAKRQPQSENHRIQRSKSVWLGMTGVWGNKRNQKKRPLPKPKGRSG